MSAAEPLSPSLPGLGPAEAAVPPPLASPAPASPAPASLAPASLAPPAPRPPRPAETKPPPAAKAVLPAQPWLARRPLAEGLTDTLKRVAFTSPLYRFSLPTRPCAEPNPVPADPWPGTLKAGQALLASGFIVGPVTYGLESVVEGRAPAAALEAWHGAAWLRDLRTVGGDPARKMARALIEAWLDRHERWSEAAWAPAVLGERVAHWLAFHDFALDAADDRLRQRVFDSAQRQAQHLARLLPGVLTGRSLGQALRGWAFAVQGLPGPAGRWTPLLRALDRALPTLIRADQTPFVVAPSQQVQVLRDLVDLRACLRLARQSEPPALTAAIESHALCVRALRLPDGGLPVLAGGSEGEAIQIDPVLAAAEVRLAPSRRLSVAGIERLTAGRSVLDIDAGAAARLGLQGSLALSFAHGRDRLFVGCGSEHPEPGWAEALSRAAAASGVVVGEREPRPPAPEAFRVQRADLALGPEPGQDTKWLEVQCAGFARPVGGAVARAFWLASDGLTLTGEEQVQAPAGRWVTLRFHLPPTLEVAPTRGGYDVLLKTAGGHYWRFEAEGATPAIEDSLSLLGRCQRRAQQIVLRAQTQAGGAAPLQTVLRWRLAKLQRPR